MATPDLSAVLRWPSAEARLWVAALVDWAERLGRLDAVVAVGSAVRPGVPSLDVDLVLIHRGAQAPEFPAPPLGVELTLFARSDLEELLASGHDLLGWAVRLGRPLYDREACWACLRERWRDRVPLPSPADASERAAKAARRLSAQLAAGDDEGARETLVKLLTQEGRARLLRAGQFPASRPELAGQLRTIGEESLARALEAASEGRLAPAAVVDAAGLRLPSAQWTPG